MNVFDDVAGGLDHLAGSTDEAIGRTFDDEAGGGIWDGFASTGDHLAGSVDESIGRQFDDTAGGGFIDETANTVISTGLGVGDFLAGDVDETVGRTLRWGKWAIAGVLALGGYLVVTQGGSSDA